MKGGNQDINEMIRRLKRYFLRRKDVLMAFVFGSAVQGNRTADSDIDIGVYLKSESNRIEIEADDVKYNTDDLWLEIERITGREVDLVVLNRAPATIVDSILRGIPILIRDKGLYIEFMLRITAIGEDFRECIYDYWALKENIGTGL